jgi:hypothetical protein
MGCGILPNDGSKKYELRFLLALLERNVRFMVVDDNGIREALRECGAAYVPPLHLNPPMFAGGGVELFDIVLTMSGLGRFDEELRECVDIPLGNHKLKVLSLRRILVSKRAANRLKDRLVIPVLEDTLAVQNTPEGPASDAKES